MKLHLIFKQRVDELVVLVDGNHMTLELPSAATLPYCSETLPFTVDDVDPMHRVAIPLKEVHDLGDKILSAKRRGRPAKKSGLYRFEEWYAMYPRKSARGAAEKSWASLNPSDELIDTMMRAVAAQAQTQDWQKDGGSFIPYPATWINQKRWMDEVPAGTVTAISTNQYADKPWGQFIAKGELVEVLNLMVQVGMDDSEAVSERLEADGVVATCDWLWGFRATK